MQRIAIDMDEVVADTMTQYLNRYNEEFAIGLTAEHFRGRRIFEVIDVDHFERVREYFEDEKFFADIPVMPGGQEVVEALTKRYEIFITTAAMEVPCSFIPKFEWLKQHFPFIPASNIVFCGDKSIIAADYMIDDNVRHFRQFRGEGIVYSAPHNMNVTAFRRVDNWEDVRRMFLDQDPESRPRKS